MGAYFFYRLHVYFFFLPAVFQHGSSKKCIKHVLYSLDARLFQLSANLGFGRKAGGCWVGVVTGSFRFNLKLLNYLTVTGHSPSQKGNAYKSFWDASCAILIVIAHD